MNPNTGKPPGSRVINVQPSDVKHAKISKLTLKRYTRKLDLMTFYI